MIHNKNFEVFFIGSISIKTLKSSIAKRNGMNEKGIGIMFKGFSLGDAKTISNSGI
jgi:hypothetical protein